MTEITNGGFAPPPFWLGVSEVLRAVEEFWRSSYPNSMSEPRGDGHPILVIPGFLAGDNSTWILREYLTRLGYRSQPWTLGFNMGPGSAVLEKLSQRVESLRNEHGGPITLIGHSLGGLYAREIARATPANVRLVVTLGSPIQSPYGKAVRSLAVEALKKHLGRCFTGSFGAAARISQPTTVPSVALYSRNDGICGWKACMELESPYTQNVEVVSSHCGMTVNPAVLDVIAEVLFERSVPPCLAIAA